jgi:hypothetical protein
MNTAFMNDSNGAMIGDFIISSIFSKPHNLDFYCGRE